MYKVKDWMVEIAKYLFKGRTVKDWMVARDCETNAEMKNTFLRVVSAFGSVYNFYKCFFFFLIFLMRFKV